MVSRTIHVLQNVVHRHDVRTRQVLWKPRQVWDVDEIAAKTAENLAEFETASDRDFRRGESHAVEVGRKRPDFADFLGRSDHDVFSVAIQPSERTENVPDVSTDAKISNAPDIYGQPHGESIRLFLTELSGTLEPAVISE
jgi:hypothetical protein